MDPISALERNLAVESKAYGYTLTIWGAGALVINVYGVPTAIEVFAYVVGALGGFAVLAAFAFTGFFVEESDERTVNVVVASMVHVFATLGNLVVSYLLLTFVETTAPGTLAFALIGMQATVGYNLLLLFEESIAKWIAERE